MIAKGLPILHLTENGDIFLTLLGTLIFIVFPLVIMFAIMLKR